MFGKVAAILAILAATFLSASQPSYADDTGSDLACDGLYWNANNRQADRCFDFSNRDLRGRDFTRFDLSKVNFSGADLSGANFTASSLWSTNFQGAILRGAKFSGFFGHPNFAGADLSNVYFESAQHSFNYSTQQDWSQTILNSTTFGGAVTNVRLPKIQKNVNFQQGLGNVIVEGSDLSTTSISSVVWDVDFSNARLAYNSLSGAYLLDGVILGPGRQNNCGSTFPILLGKNVSYSQNLYSRPSPIACDFRGLDLSGSSFKGADLSGSNFSNLDLRLFDFSDSKLVGSDFTSTKLSGADLSNSDLQGTKLDAANLVSANLAAVRSGSISGKPLLDKSWALRKGYLVGPKANLSGAFLQGVDLSGSNLAQSDISNANLSGANLSKANLSNSNLTRAVLQSANLSGANLSKANLSNSNLTRAVLQSANLSGANLSKTNLSYSDLRKARLTSVDLRSANKKGARF